MAGKLALAVAVLAALSGCGAGTEPQTLHAVAPQGPDPVHVHGLGVDPADGALLIATHNGLFRLAADDSRPRLVGETLYDLMGFTVVGPGHFLASGHPDPGSMREQGLPPHLGLIESRDAGATWQSVSLLGEADFHVLRVAGERVYGFDATHGRLLASADGGRSWAERRARGSLVDVVLDPGDPDHLVAAGAQGLHRTRDAARSWERLGDVVGLLAWPEDGVLYLVDGTGTVLGSREGEIWERLSEVGGEPAAFLATGARELLVALHDGSVKRSTDGGRGWSVLVAAGR